MNAFALLLTAQGTPCLLAGDEFFNSQKGNNNVYCQDNETGWVNWTRLKTDDSLFRYVQSLIAFRRAHPCLHKSEPLRGLDRTACGVRDVSFHGENAWQVRSDFASRQLGVMYSGSEVDDDECFIAYNMHWIPHSYALPFPGKKKAWFLAADTERGILEEPVLLENQKSTELPERSIAVMIGRKNDEDTEAEPSAARRSRRKKSKKQADAGKVGNNEGSKTFLHDNKA